MGRILDFILYFEYNKIRGDEQMVYTTDEIKLIITPIAKKYNLKAVFLFGSYARNTANENSDIDLMVDTTDTDLNSLFKLGALYEELSSAFCKEVDLITVSSIEQPIIRQSEITFRENILKERKSLYAVA